MVAPVWMHEDVGTMGKSFCHLLGLCVWALVREKGLRGQWGSVLWCSEQPVLAAPHKLLLNNSQFTHGSKALHAGNYMGKTDCYLLCDSKAIRKRLAL